MRVVGKRTITLDGLTVSYTIKRSARARHVRLEVRADSGLTVIVPKSFDIGRVPGVLQPRRRWILVKLSRYSEAQSSPAGRKLESGDTVPYLGRALKVARAGGPEGAVSVKLQPGRLVVSPGRSSTSLSLIVEAWYRLQAKRFLRDRADGLSAEMGLGYQRLTIRGQRTRWGSCSRAGNLSFNWKLMMAPEPVVDYVIVHELAHLKEMNHTRRFWELVGRYCPRWQQHRKWLKLHEAELAGRLL